MVKGNKNLNILLESGQLGEHFSLAGCYQMYAINSPNLYIYQC